MDKALARRPPDDVVEGELIVRSPSLGWGQVLFMVATIVGFTVWHNWLYGHPLSRALKPYNVVVGLLVFVVVVLKYVVVPPWLRISSAGIAFGQGGSIRRYRWKDIRWFAVHNRKHGALDFQGTPEAFVALNPTGTLSPDAVKLPRFQGYSPEELVAMLEEKRHIFAPPTHPPNAPR